MPDRQPPNDLPPAEWRELLSPEEFRLVCAGLDVHELSDLRQMLIPATPAFRSSFVRHFDQAEGWEPASRRMLMAFVRATADAMSRACDANPVREASQ